MPMGYCKTCEKLCSIQLSLSPWPSAVPLDEIRLGQTRQAVWVPVPHEGPDGKACPGVKRAI